MLKIENIENFNLDDTVTCGQIFRYTSLEDGSYTIVLDDRVINVKYKNNTLYVESNNYDNLKEIYMLINKYASIKKKKLLNILILIGIMMQ